jgi:hypothetical protein
MNKIMGHQESRQEILNHAKKYSPTRIKSRQEIFNKNQVTPRNIQQELSHAKKYSTRIKSRQEIFNKNQVTPRNSHQELSHAKK